MTDPKETARPKAQIEDLIARLEKLTGPSRDLDRAVDIWANPTDWEIGPGARKDYAQVPQRLIERGVPKYTASLDAAVSLLPDEYYWMFAKGRLRAEEPLFGIALYRHDEDEPFIEAQHEMGSIALCIAALRGHASLSREGE